MAKSKMLICTLLLRLLALVATLSAAIVMATSHERITIFIAVFEAKYSYSPAFKYFVITNAIGSVYGFLVLFVPTDYNFLGQLVVALDVVFTMLLTSSLSAALAVGYVGKKGNSHAGWLPICDQVHKYCDHAMGALVAGFIGVIIYMVLLLYSVLKISNPLPLQKV